VLVLLSAPAWAEITSNLAVYYMLDGTSGTGTATDSSGNGNTGTLTNMNTSTAWVAGKINNGLTFAGDNDFVRTTQSSTYRPTTSLTVAVWIKPVVSSADYSAVVGLPYRTDASWSAPYATYAITRDGGGTATRAQVVVGGGAHGCGGGTAWGATDWAHFAVTYDGETLTCFANGSADVNTAPSGNLDYNGVIADLVLGTRSATAPDEYCTCTLDEVRIYSGRVLNSTEIAELYAYTGAPARKRLFILSQRLRWWVGSAAVARMWGGPALWRYGARALLALEGR
jgi:hypothetical protein